MKEPEEKKEHCHCNGPITDWVSAETMCSGPVKTCHTHQPASGEKNCTCRPLFPGAEVCNCACPLHGEKNKYNDPNYQSDFDKFVQEHPLKDAEVSLSSSHEGDKQDCICDLLDKPTYHASDNIHSQEKKWVCPVHGFQERYWLIHKEKEEYCKHCNEKDTEPATAGWREEFNKEFVRDDGLMDKYGYDDDGDPIETAFLIKDFIERTLKARDAKIINTIEASKMGWVDEGYEAGRGVKENISKLKEKAYLEGYEAGLAAGVKNSL